MKKEIIITSFAAILLIATLVSAAQQDVFVLTLEYNKGDIAVQNLLVTKGYFTTPINQPADGYILELISSKNKVLYKQTFDFPLEVHFSPPPKEWFDEIGNQIYIPNESETRTVLDAATVELIFPYNDDAARIEIYYPNKTRALSMPVNTESEAAIENVRLDTAEKSSDTSLEKEGGKSTLTNKSIILIVVAIFLSVIIFIILVLFILSKRKQHEETYSY